MSKRTLAFFWAQAVSVALVAGWAFLSPGLEYRLADAARGGNVTAMRVYTALGADPGGAYEEQMCDHADYVRVIDEAAAGGHIGALRFLIEHGAPFDVPNLYGNTALWYAARDGKLEAATFLISEGAKVRARDWEIASHNGHRAVAELLEQQGAGPRPE